MRKYKALFRCCWMDALVSRAESLVWMFGDIMPPLAMLVLWSTVYQDRLMIAGYTLSMMIVYYLGMMILETLFTPHCEEWLSHLIREGELSPFLLRPVSVIAYFIWSEISWRILRFLLLLVPLGLVVYKLLASFSLPALGFGQIVVLLISLPCSYILHFTFKFLLGSTTFWFIESRGLFNLFYITNSIFSGSFLPLDLFPKLVIKMSNFLPFKYIYYFPLNIALGKLVGWDLMLGLGTQVFWLVVFGSTMIFVWRQGLRRYGAVGG